MWWYAVSTVSVLIKVFFDVLAGRGETGLEIQCTLKTLPPTCVPRIVRAFDSPSQLKEFLSAANITIDLSSIRSDVGVVVTSEQLRVFGIQEDERRRLGFVD